MFSSRDVASDDHVFQIQNGCHEMTDALIPRGLSAFIIQISYTVRIPIF